MAVQVGELYARLTLNDAEFNRKLKAAEQNMGKVAKASTAAFAAIAGSITAAAVAASKYASESQALAGQTGLATEAVQALGFAARRSEADLALLGTGMRGLVRRAAEAAQGHQGFAASFDQLGLSSERLAELLRDPEQLLMEVADGLAALPTEAQASAAAMGVMSDAGRQLVPMLRQGSSEIRTLMSDAERMGLVMSGQAIKDLSDFGDEWETTKERIAAVTRTLSAEFLPTLRAALDTVDGAIDRIQSMNEGTRQLIGTIGSGTIGAVGTFAALTTGIWAAQRAMLALGTVFKLASGPTGWIMLAATGLISVAAGLQTAKKHADELHKSILEHGDEVDIRGRIMEITALLASLDAKEAELRRELDEIRAINPDDDWAMHGGLIISTGPLERRLANVSEEREKLEEELSGLNKRLEELAEAAEAGGDGLDGLGEGAGDAGKRVKTLNEILADHEQRLLESSRLADLMGNEYDRAGEDLRHYMRTLQDAAEAGLHQEDAILAIAAAFREMAEAMGMVDEIPFMDRIFGTSEATRFMEAVLLRAQAGFPLPMPAPEYYTDETGARVPVDSHWLGEIPWDAEHQALKAIEGVMQELERTFEAMVEDGKEWSDDAIEVLRTLVMAQDEAERLRAKLFPEPEPVAPTPVPLDMIPAPSLMPQIAGTIADPMREIIEQFGLLREQAQAGVTPVGDVVAQLMAMRATVIDMAGGSLADATEEQLRLWNDLSEAIKRFNEVQKTRLQEIEADYARAMGVGMAVDSEIARALGLDFDPITYEMGVLQQHIMALAEVHGQITPEMEEYLRQLGLLNKDLDYKLLQEGVYNNLLEGVIRNLGGLGDVLRGTMSFDGGQFSFSPQQFAINSALAIADAIFGMSKSQEHVADRMEAAAEAMERASHGWRESLTDSQFHELLDLDASDLIADLDRQIAGNEHVIKQLQDRWLQVWNAASRGQQIRDLEAQNRELQKLRDELEDGWEFDIDDRITDLLGVGARSLQGAVASAFGAGTVEDFTDRMESSLTGKVRNAFVTAFLESETMAPMYESLGEAIRDAVMDSEITPGEMDGIREMMEEIQASSLPFWELLSEFGLLADTTERLNRQMGRLVNVPLGIRALQELRFASATPQVVPQLVGAQAAQGGGDLVFTGPITVRADDPQSFEQQMRRYNRRRGLRNTGNPVGGGRR